MSDFEPMINPSPRDREPVVADAMLPGPVESAALVRARRPLPLGRKLRGLMGGVALMGFTLLMMWIVIFDGLRMTSEYTGDSFGPTHDSYQSWRIPSAVRGESAKRASR